MIQLLTRFEKLSHFRDRVAELGDLVGEDGVDDVAVLEMVVLFLGAVVALHHHLDLLLQGYGLDDVEVDLLFG